jgi:hypothetical protein
VLLATAFTAGLTAALARHLSLSLTPAASSAALKATWLACNVAGESDAAALGMLPITPLLIAHLGGAYGPELVLQSAWALGNIAAAGVELGDVLLGQGVVPALLAALWEGAREGAAEPATADAAAVCAWALCAVVEGVGERAANALLDARPGGACSRALCAALMQSSAVELAVEAAWLMAHVVATGTPAAQQLCGRSTWPSVHAAAVSAIRSCAMLSDETRHKLGGAPGHGTGGSVGRPCGWGAGAADDEEPAPPQAAVPLLRAIGNLFPLMSSTQAALAVAFDDGALPRTLLAALQFPSRYVAASRASPPTGSVAATAGTEDGAAGCDVRRHDAMEGLDSPPLPLQIALLPAGLGETGKGDRSRAGASASGSDHIWGAGWLLGDSAAEICWVLSNMAATSAGTGVCPSSNMLS